MYGAYAGQVEAILKDIKEKGDEALFAYTERFDGVRLDKDSFRVTPKEIREAYEQVDPRRDTRPFRRAHRHLRTGER